MGGAALPLTLAPAPALAQTLTLALTLFLPLPQARLFLELCILSGCDYLPHLRGLAINTAHRLLCAHRNVEHVVKVSDPTPTPNPNPHPYP